MSKLFVDAGTTYTKIIESDGVTQELAEYKVDEKNNNTYYILPSKVLRELNLEYYRGCGHMAEQSENEIIALVKGCKNIIEPNATILDLGSRDSKWIKFKNNKFNDMDWNTSCASSTGATIEMLLKFYDINPDDVVENDEKFVVTCGIFGLEKIMDDISNGTNPNDAIAKFIHGIAYNAWTFTKRPEKLYLSGGFCENKCFVDTLSNYCEVVKLGRFKLCEGLICE